MVAGLALSGRVAARFGRRREWLQKARETAAQEERNRLARDLHDSIKQQIFSMSMNAAAAEARWTTDPGQARVALSRVRESAREAMVEMEAMLQHLRPAPLENIGLIEALRKQCEALGYRTGAQIEAALGELPAETRLPAGAHECIFRVVQEALANIARHARAANVTVGLREERGELAVEVRDDGQGFEAPRDGAGMGLGNMRQRAREIGGTVDIDSAPGRGTGVRLKIPLAAAAAEPPPEDPMAERLSDFSTAGFATVVVLGTAGRFVPSAIPWVVLFASPLWVPCAVAAVRANVDIRRELGASGRSVGARHPRVLLFERDLRARLAFLFWLAFWINPWYWGIKMYPLRPVRQMYLAAAIVCLAAAVIHTIRLHRVMRIEWAAVAPADFQIRMLERWEKARKLLTGGLLVLGISALVLMTEVTHLGLLICLLAYMTYIDRWTVCARSRT